MIDAYLSYLTHRMATLGSVELQPFLPGDSWVDGELQGRPIKVTAKRDFDPAATEDLEFISHALDDMRRLVNALGADASLSNDELLAIQWRAMAASPGPWLAYLEQDGVGGCDVIVVNDKQDSRDLYLYVDGFAAPAWLYAEVARARQDIPCLVQWIQDVRRA